MKIFKTIIIYIFFFFKIIILFIIYYSQDQWDGLSVYSQKGIDFLDLFARFIKERIGIENEYAKALR